MSRKGPHAVDRFLESSTMACSRAERRAWIVTSLTTIIELHHTANRHTTYMHHIDNMHAAYTQRTCIIVVYDIRNIHHASTSRMNTSFMQHICSIHATRVHHTRSIHACIIHALYMQHVRNTHATHTQHTRHTHCNIYLGSKVNIPAELLTSTKPLPNPPGPKLLSLTRRSSTQYSL